MPREAFLALLAPIAYALTAYRFIPVAVDRGKALTL